MGEGRDDPLLQRWEFEMNKTIHGKRVAGSKGEVQSQIPRAQKGISNPEAKHVCWLDWAGLEGERMC